MKLPKSDKSTAFGAWIGFLEREFNLHNVAEAGELLSRIRGAKVVHDLDVYRISHLENVARKRDTERADVRRAKFANRAAKKAAQAEAVKAQEKLARVEASRAALTRKIGR